MHSHEQPGLFRLQQVPHRPGGGELMHGHNKHGLQGLSGRDVPVDARATHMPGLQRLLYPTTPEEHAMWGHKQQSVRGVS